MFKAGVVLAGATLVASQVTVAEYCTALLAQCPGKHGIDSQPNCLTVFDTTTTAGYTLGTANESDVDSIECRYKFLVAPLNASATKCQYAGPTGGGKCGSVVDGACRAATNACPEQSTAGSSYADFATCQTGLADLGAQWGWTQGAAAAGEDTLECRAYHAITGLVSATVHCSHYNRTGSPCEAGAPVPDATGTHYCNTIMDACTGANAQYPDMVSCMRIATVFRNFPNDTRASNQNNSLGCREYHAQAAKADPALHCEHAGPSGGGACGLATSYAQAWATIAKGVCNDSDVEAALTSLGAAQLNLAVPDKVAANGKYSTTSDTNNNTQACRIYHLTVAATGAMTHCSHGSLHGDSQCGGTPSATFCKFAEGVCGVGTAAYQFASSSACMTAVTAAANNVTLGTGADRSQNTLGCRFYHLGVAGSYKAGGSAMANATLMQQHCSHVLVPAMGAGGCGSTAMAPTNGPMAPTTSSAAALTFSAAFIAVFSTLAL